MLSRKKKSTGNPPGNGSEINVRASLPAVHSTPSVPSLAQGQGLTRNSSSSTNLSRKNGSTSVKVETEQRLAAGVGNGKYTVVNGMRVLLPPTVAELLEGIMPKAAQGQSNGVKNDAQRARDVQKFFSCLTDWETVNDQTLVKMITLLKGSVDSLDDKMTPVLSQILAGDWICRSPKVVSVMESFLFEYLVVRPNQWGMVMTNFIRKLIPKAQVDVEDDISIAEQQVFSIAHRNLKRIFELFPMKQLNCVKTMNELFPYMGKGAHVHFAYVTNILEAVEYLPKVQDQLYQVLIQRLSFIDTNIPKKDIEAAAEPRNSHSFTIKNEDGGQELFSMDLDDVPVEKENQLIPTIDMCMDLMFQHFEQIFKAKAQPESDEGFGEEESPVRQDNLEQQSLFNHLLNIFEVNILPISRINNVPFLYFYVLSLQPTFPNLFLDLLWKKAINVSTPTIYRVQAMAYLSGILARAQYISVKTLKRWMMQLAKWANDYVNKKSQSCHWSSVKIEAHGPFYAVCQTIFYVFAFRNKELLGSRKCARFTKELDLGRLVNSELNPLKACNAETAREFVHAAYLHDISYFKTVLERNQRATIPTIAHENLSTIGNQSDLFSSTRLQAFFPFDPLLLSRSRKWIDSIYRNYEPYLEEVKTEKVEPTEETEDSIEMELGSYCGTPGGRSNGFYCNGAMPFKFKTEIKNELEVDTFMD